MITLYDTARDAMLRGQLDWFDATMRVLFIDSTYVPDFAAHVNETHLPAGAILGQTLPLVTIENTAGYASAEDALGILLDFSRPATQMVLVEDPGTGVGSRLIAHITDEPGLPTQPQDEDVVIEWAPSFPGIFRP